MRISNTARGSYCERHITRKWSGGAAVSEQILARTWAGGPECMGGDGLG